MFFLPFSAVLIMTQAVAADHPAPQIMSAAERRAQVAARNGVCNGTVVVASCWGFDPADSTEFLQVCAPPLLVVLLRSTQL
jgi:hypothetical protein